jgi:chorismate synthase
LSSNRFGKHFCITTWGESHGKAIGVVIDGCPAGLSIDEEMINKELYYRKPGRNPYVTPRKEEDCAQILSGVFGGYTTGAPISLIIPNQNQNNSPYEAMKNIYRPGHSNFTYLQKYGIFDHLGGGRSSGRETACRVAAGAIAKAFLELSNISIVSSIFSIGNLQVKNKNQKPKESPLFCPDSEIEKEMKEYLFQLKEEGNSIGGSIETIVTGIPAGLGEPIYEKIEAILSLAILSIPAFKGIYFGDPLAHLMKGSDYQDPFQMSHGEITLQSNHCGGVLGGITTGSPLAFTAWCKPPSSIKIPIESITLNHEKTTFQIPSDGKHDPCIAIRAVPVIEAMTALTLADFVLAHRLSKI